MAYWLPLFFPAARGGFATASYPIVSESPNRSTHVFCCGCTGCLRNCLIPNRFQTTESQHPRFSLWLHGAVLQRTGTQAVPKRGIAASSFFLSAARGGCVTNCCTGGSEMQNRSRYVVPVQGRYGNPPLRFVPPKASFGPLPFMWPWAATGFRTLPARPLFCHYNSTTSTCPSFPDCFSSCTSRLRNYLLPNRFPIVKSQYLRFSYQLHGAPSQLPHYQAFPNCQIAAPTFFVVAARDGCVKNCCTGGSEMQNRSWYVVPVRRGYRNSHQQLSSMRRGARCFW